MKGTEFFAVYTRVSSSKQDEGLSDDRQRKECIEYGQTQGWTFLDGAVIHDTHTGKEFKKRKNVSKVIDLLESGRVQHVVFHKVDRISRDQLVLREFFADIYDNGGTVSVVDKQKTYKTEREAVKDTRLDSLIAEIERESIAERNYGGKIDQFNAGSIIAKVPYGYDSELTINKSGKRFRCPVINPVEQANIIGFLEAFCETRSIKAAVDFAREKGMKGRAWRRKGKTQQEGLPFSHTTFKDTISHLDEYVGMEITQHFGEKKEFSRQFKYPELITPDLYNRVRNAYNRKTRPVRNGIKPFSNIVFCANCGSPARIVYKEKPRLDMSNPYITYIYGCSRNHTQSSKNYRVNGKHSSPECGRTVRITQMTQIVNTFLDSASLLADSSKYAEELTKSVYELIELKDDIESTKQEREDKKADRQKIVNRLLNLYDEKDESLKGLLIPESNAQLKQIDQELDAFSSDLKDSEKAFLDLQGVLEDLGLKVDDRLIEELQETAPPLLSSFSFDLPAGQMVNAADIAKSILAAPSIPLVVQRQSEAAARMLAGVKAAIEAEDWETVNESLYRLGVRVYVNFSEKLPHGGKSEAVSHRVTVSLEDRISIPARSDTLSDLVENTTKGHALKNIPVLREALTARGVEVWQPKPEEQEAQEGRLF